MKSTETNIFRIMLKSGNNLYPLAVCLLMLFTSCRKDLEPKEPYFKFDRVGEELLSGLKLNDTLKFAGSNGTNIGFRVFMIETLKQSVRDCSWTLGNCVTYYHYDDEKIHFVRTDSVPMPPGNPLSASLTKQMQMPSGIDKANIPDGTQAKARVYGQLVDFNAIPPPGPVLTSPFITYPDFYSPVTFVNYSNAVKTYSQVVIIKSNNDTVYTSALYGYRYTVNEVWFDMKYGMVFFKDVYGNSWSRTN